MKHVIAYTTEGLGLQYSYAYGRSVQKR